MIHIALQVLSSDLEKFIWTKAKIILFLQFWEFLVS